MANIYNTNSAELNQIHKVLDADNKSILTRSEMLKALEVLDKSISLKDRRNLLERIRSEEVIASDKNLLEWMFQRQDKYLDAELREIFNLIDVDLRKHLDFEEFIQLTRCLSPISENAEITKAIQNVDEHGNGEIDFEELTFTQQIESELKNHIATLHDHQKILLQYAKVAEVSSVVLIEVDSDLGAGKRGASQGIEFLKQAAITNQNAKIQTEKGIINLDKRSIQNENHALEDSKIYPHAKYIDAIYKVFERTADVVASTLQDGLFPLVLGGDHSTAAGTIAGIKKAFPNHKLGVVWIDAHADIHSPHTTPSGNMHGMPLAIATAADNLDQQINQIDEETNQLWEMCKALGVEGKANLDIKDLIYVSVRDIEKAENSLIQQYQIPIITTDELRAIGAESAAQKCLDYLSEVDLIYVTFDVDSMDSSICMGTGTPVSGGIWADEARDLNTALVRDPRVCCWEICEINPSLDTLNTLAENSLEVFESVVDTIGNRLEKQVECERLEIDIQSRIN